MRMSGRHTGMVVALFVWAGVAGAQVLLRDDFRQIHSSPLPDNYQLEVASTSPAVVAVRPSAGEHLDLEVHEDGLCVSLIDRSILPGDRVQFLVLDGAAWAGPPNRGARVSGATEAYVVEAQNALESHATTDSWAGGMTLSLGGPVLDVGPPGSWESDWVAFSSVLFNGSSFEMWYSGSAPNPGGYSGPPYEIGYATSPDGAVWTKSVSNPVLRRGRPGSFDYAQTVMPSVLYDGSSYRMWYAGRDQFDQPNKVQIGYAISPDPTSWVKSAGNPVLVDGLDFEFDDRGVLWPSVLQEAGLFKIWYTGQDQSAWRIGLATSPDGVNWTRDASNPVLGLGPAGAWDEKRVYGCTVLSVSGPYRMWYSGETADPAPPFFRIGSADSNDGAAWTRSADNPVLDAGPPGSWDELGVWSPAVVFDGTTYRMWYNGAGSEGHVRIGYATSTDGTRWTKFPVPEVVDAFQIPGVAEGALCDLTLTVPATADLDLFVLQGSGGPDDALASSCNRGVGLAETVRFTAPVPGTYTLVITNEDGGSGEYSISFRGEPPVRLHRGVVPSLAPGWQSASLPLTAGNDDENLPFPIPVTPPGSVTDSFTGPEPLVLYRMLTAGVTPMGNTVRVTKAGGPIEISY